MAGGPRWITLVSRAAFTPRTRPALPLCLFFNGAQDVFLALGRERQREPAQLVGKLRGRLHRVVSLGHEAVHEPSVFSHATSVVLVVLIAELAVSARAPEQVKVGAHVRRQFDGHQPGRVHGERVKTGAPITDDQRIAAFVPRASDLEVAGDSPQRRFTFGGHLLLRGAHYLRREGLVRVHDSAESHQQRQCDQRRAAKHRAAFRTWREDRRAKHQRHAQTSRQRRGTRRVEVDADAEDQGEGVVAEVVGAPLAGLPQGVEEQQADGERRRHHQLECEVDNARADAGDPTEQNVVREPRLRIGEDHPNTPKRVTNVDDREAEQHGKRGCANHHRRHHAGAVLGVHGHPRRGQDTPAHGNLSNQRHRKGVGGNGHDRGADQHRGNRAQQPEDRLR